MESRAALLTGERRVKTQRFSVPDRLEPGQAVLRVEACGMCGTDAEQYSGALAAKSSLFRYPCVTGHEFVGHVERLDEVGAARWGITEGQRVGVAPHVGCGVCEQCYFGRRYLCPSVRAYGFTPADVAPLSGGFADHVVLQANSVLYPIADHIPTRDAVLFNPLGAGYEWVRLAGTTVGDTVVIIGPGQRGLAAVLAAREFGASRVIVAGRGRRPWKLDLAKRFGATHVVNTDEDDLVAAVRDITGGSMADQAIDLSHLSLQPIVDAVKSVRVEGTVVLAGFKGVDTVPGLDPDEIWLKALTIRGMRGSGDWGRLQACRTLAEGRYDFDCLHTHDYTIEQLEEAIHVLSGEIPADPVLHITVTPG